MVHSIVLAHGGQITVASTPGRGTRFDILFLIHSAADAKTALAPAREHSAAARPPLVSSESSRIKVTGSARAPADATSYREARRIDSAA